MSIKVFISQNLCGGSYTHAKPISSTHSGHHTDSGISMSGNMTSAITKEGTSVSVSSGSNNEHLNGVLQGKNGIPW